MDSMMLLITVLNYSVGSTNALVVTGVGVLLGTSEGRLIVVVGSGPEGSKTVDLMSEEEGGERLV